MPLHDDDAGKHHRTLETLRAAIRSENPVVRMERERVLRELHLGHLSGDAAFLQGRRRLMRRLTKPHRYAAVERLLIVARLAHGEEVGAGAAKVA
jgi:hypothetical protein